jgi:hypothetical protein
MFESSSIITGRCDSIGHEVSIQHVGTCLMPPLMMSRPRQCQRGAVTSLALLCGIVEHWAVKAETKDRRSRACGYSVTSVMTTGALYLVESQPAATVSFVFQIMDVTLDSVT